MRSESALTSEDKILSITKISIKIIVLGWELDKYTTNVALGHVEKHMLLTLSTNELYLLTNTRAQYMSVFCAVLCLR